MATLVILSPGFDNRIVPLRLGVNRVGRNRDLDVPIEHPTLSTFHCEIELRDDGVLLVRDHGSTNGTFLEGAPVTEAVLSAGQKLRMGDVELLVESTDATVAIPQFDRPMPAPPIFRDDGAIFCRQHEDAPARWRCTHCRETLCDRCLHRLRRRKGQVLLLCPLCSHPCEPIGGQAKPKKSILDSLFKTVKLPRLRRRPPPGK